MLSMVLDIVFDKTPALDKNGHHYALDHIDGDGKKVSLITLDNVVNVYYGIDEKRRDESGGQRKAYKS